jgi:hypothetical protein
MSKVDLYPPQSLTEVLSLFLIGATIFFGEHVVNPTSPVSSHCHTLAPGLYRSETGGL